MTTTTESRVAAGAAALDEKFPGWWKKIDTDRLDMSVWSCCVAGQLGADAFGEGLGRSNVRRVLQRLLGTDDDVSLYGGEAVSLALGEHASTSLTRYRELTDEWREVINDRKEQHGRST